MNKIEEKLIQSASLPTVPTVAQRLLELFDREAGFEELAEAIAIDPSLTASLLRVINSAMYGMTREVTSVQQALLYLGVNAVRSIALSFSFVRGIRDQSAADRDVNALWQLSLMSALTARRIGIETGDWDGEDAFLTGLLADCGALVMYGELPDYREIIQRFLAGDGDLTALEQESIGTDHASVGSRVLEHWNFPPSICETVRDHHGDGDGEAHQRILGSAWACARALTVESFNTEVADLGRWLSERHDLSVTVVEALLSELPTELRAIASTFELSANEQRSYEDLLSEANSRLREIVLEVNQEVTASAGRSGFEDLRDALKDEAERDATGLVTREFFVRVLQAYMPRAQKLRRPLALMVVELAEVKYLGDGEPPVPTSRSFEALAQILPTLVRSTDEAGRFGPIQAALLLPGCELENLHAVADRLRTACEGRPLELDDEPFAVQLHFGLAVAHPAEGAIDVQGLIDAASAALEEARDPSP